MTLDPARRRLYKGDIARRNSRSIRCIDMWIASGKFPAPHRDEAGRRFWWSDEIARHEAALTEPA